MRVNIYVDGNQVGFRAGCDVLVNGDSCKATSVGSTFYHGGMPRDICDSCIVKMAPGREPLQFKSSHYDSTDERFSTTNSSQEPNKIHEDPTESDVPKLPTCPHCGGRSFSVSQILVESKQYDWDSDMVAFRPVGDPNVDQKALYHCKGCSKEVPAGIVSNWIS